MDQGDHNKNRQITFVVIAVVVLMFGILALTSTPNQIKRTTLNSESGVSVSGTGSDNATASADSKSDSVGGAAKPEEAAEAPETAPLAGSASNTASKMSSKTNTGTNTGSNSGSKSSFTNKYGTATTKCAHAGCNNYIASSGDTNCCTLHSNKCLECGKYIDEDAAYCMDCITKAAKGSKTSSSSSSSSSGSFTNAYGSATTKCAHPGCNNPIASSGDTNCCTIHSKRCLECGKYIDEDAMYCMSCLSKALQPSTSSGGSPSGSSGMSTGSSSSGSLDFSGYSDSMSDAEFDAWLDDVLGDY